MIWLDAYAAMMLAVSSIGLREFFFGTEESLNEAKENFEGGRRLFGDHRIRQMAVFIMLFQVVFFVVAALVADRLWYTGIATILSIYTVYKHTWLRNHLEHLESDSLHQWVKGAVMIVEFGFIVLAFVFFFGG